LFTLSEQDALSPVRSRDFRPSSGSLAQQNSSLLMPEPHVEAVTTPP
jgi:hypothetical protein